VGRDPLYANISDQGADAVVEKAVQAALDAGVAERGTPSSSSVA